MEHATRERNKRHDRRALSSVPLSTYRVQLTADFTFDDASRILPYLARLGVGCLYLSPILEAAPGSTHFYDVVDHSRVSEVLGGIDGLRDLSWKAGELGISLIADIVPNHMAVPTPAYHNRALWSVLCHGADSPYAHWFDVDWTTGEPVLMAVLGDRIGTVLARGELTVDEMIVPGHEDEGPVPVLRYYDHVFPVKPGTQHLPIDSLLDAQPYRLAYWRVGNEELNYRRFFDVRSLVGLRVEDPDVFEKTHRLMIDLVLDGTLRGLRVDHPDGLADPTAYVNQLSQATDGAWIVVEKILEDEERLPGTWKVAGTTGYDAAWRIDALLRDPAGNAPLAATMHRVTHDAMGELDAIVDQAKREILADSLRSEVQRLASLAHGVCMADVRLRDHTWGALHDCLVALLASFPRYRAYITPGTPPLPASLEAIDSAATRARNQLDPERHETLDLVVDLVKGLEAGSAGRTAEATRLELVRRFQQVCGAVMAKGVEDTAYYRWTHLLALCEVGAPAARFSLPPDAFHAWAAERQVTTPLAMNVLSTHDSKRSGDVRARLGVLSERAAEWDEWIERVRGLTADMRPAELDGRTENMWWQLLVGSVDDAGELMAWDRLETAVTKALREAKSHTSWTDQDPQYESAVLWFAQATHADPRVRELVDEWTQLTAGAVRASVLSHALIHLTMPGVPDVYQGTEAYRPLLVDPDNRIPVDFPRLDAALARLESGARPKTLSEEKLWVTATALAARRREADAFVSPGAGYVPLASSSGNAVVFARTVRDEPRVIAVATRAATELDRLGGWREHSVQLPDGAWTDALTGASFSGATRLAQLLKSLPVALLVRT